MRQFSSSIFVAALVVLPAHLAAADNLLGLYVGGAVGQGQVAVSAYSASYASQAVGSNVAAGADELKENHVAFKGIAGIRPLSLIGAELEYVDLGHVHETLFNYPADASMKGAAAFGLLYLPVPVVDIYLKAGVAHLQSSLNAAVPYQNPPPLCSICAFPRFEQDRTTTGLAAAAGIQYKFGSLAVRAEYERFNAAGEHPNLASLGMTWSF